LEYEELTSEDESSKHLIGTAKIKLNDIISNTDYINKNVQIASRITQNSHLGFINVDIKLENTNAIDFEKKESTRKVERA
jgi:cell fate (sporulation/competence/biofilm development) regulator YmcA (YheA/YmcA/DUF963 family)